MNLSGELCEESVEKKPLEKSAQPPIVLSPMMPHNRFNGGRETNPTHSPHFSVMRKIESLMNTAIQNEKDWRLANTEVINNNSVSEVFLHNNLIARVGDTFLQIFDGGWQSNTTKSRLNAILRAHGNGEGIFQKNFEWFVSTNSGTVKFTNGMILN